MSELFAVHVYGKTQQFLITNDSSIYNTRKDTAFSQLTMNVNLIKPVYNPEMLA